MNGHCLLWAWFDFVLLEVFHFQTEFSPGNTGGAPELDGSAQQPLPCTVRLFCDNPWHSPRSHLPRAVGQSPVPALPSLGDRLCVLHVCHFSSSHGTSKTLPYLTGWLTLHLFIESKGFFWISMIFYIQRITNMIADLV